MENKFKFAIGDNVKVNEKSSLYNGITGTISDIVFDPLSNTTTYKVDDSSGGSEWFSEQQLNYCRRREEPVVDMVSHPPHYEGNIECIDAMIEVLGKEGVIHFCIGNAFKYIWRCLKKHETPVEDLKKCRWYISKAIELLTEIEE